MTDLARQLGQRWETYIRRENKMLLDHGRADVSKNWEAPKIPGKHARREKSKPDFSGFLLVGSRMDTVENDLWSGQHVVFEAKSTLSKTSWPLSDLKDHQRERLNRANQTGAVAFVYLLSGERRKYVVPMDVYEWWADTDSGSIPFPARFNPRGVPVLDPYEKQRQETWLDTYIRVLDGD
jgi:recombination protein U